MSLNARWWCSAEVQGRALPFSLKVVVYYWIGFACLAAWSSVRAQEPQTEITIVDEVHTNVSRRFSDFVGQIDEFFGEDLELDQVNESWFRVRLDARSLEDEDAEFKGNVKLKLVLPSTEKRLRLLLSTEEEDTRDPNSRPTSRPSTNDDNGNVSLALRFLRDIRKDSGLRFDIGARVRDKRAQTFARIGAFIRRPVDQNWKATLSNNAVYFDQSGFEDQLTLKFERFLDSNRYLLLLNSTQLAWSEGNKGAGISQQVGIYRELSDTASVAAEFQVNVLTAPSTGEKRLRGGELRFRLRQNIWRPWFFYELTPSLSWPAEEDYRALYGGLLRIEIIFGHVN
ncbi:MAG: hypothetical protein KTR32_27650 [Granulosicoccus sp.]|nr:hypothetical protein [Granulosicoccus sp.]